MIPSRNLHRQNMRKPAGDHHYDSLPKSPPEKRAETAGDHHFYSYGILHRENVRKPDRDYHFYSYDILHRENPGLKSGGPPRELPVHGLVSGDMENQPGLTTRLSSTAKNRGAAKTAPGLISAIERLEIHQVVFLFFPYREEHGRVMKVTI
jgi:hypothetical protein